MNQGDVPVMNQQTKSGTGSREVLLEIQNLKKILPCQPWFWPYG